MAIQTIPTGAATTSASAARGAGAATGGAWRRRTFDLIALICALFVPLSAVAMLLYPGGTIMDQASQGYHFFENYLSDLGLTHARSGAVNTPSMILFIVATVSVALALGAFFHTFTGFCAGETRAHRLSRSAAQVGTVTAASFIGVAAAPRDLAYPEHIFFELLAFATFMVAVALEIAALRALERSAPPGLPRRFLWVFIGFAVVLAAYIALLAFGPPDNTQVGERVQVTGQKVIVYAAIATVLVQALQARWMVSRASTAARRGRHAGAGRRRSVARSVSGR